MARELKEWIGKTADTAIPPRIKLRVKSRANDCCENCGLRVRYGGQIDHTKAIINGGENRESNLRFLCRNCHGRKTADDVAEKSRAAKTQIHLAGFKRPCRKWPPKTPNGKTGMTRTTYYDERGRLCVRWQKQSELQAGSEKGAGADPD